MDAPTFCVHLPTLLPTSTEKNCLYLWCSQTDNNHGIFHIAVIQPDRHQGVWRVSLKFAYSSALLHQKSSVLLLTLGVALIIILVILLLLCIICVSPCHCRPPAKPLTCATRLVHIVHMKEWQALMYCILGQWANQLPVAIKILKCVWCWKYIQDLFKIFYLVQILHKVDTIPNQKS